MTRLNSHTHSDALLRVLLDSKCPQPCAWSAQDMRAVLTHLLATPLHLEADALATRSSTSTPAVAELIQEAGGGTFGSALALAAPAPEILRLIKEYAKASLQSADADLPKDVARVVYVVSILRAREVNGPALSTLSDADLAREALRLLTFTWLPSDIQSRLRASLSIVQRGAPRAQ